MNTLLTSHGWHIAGWTMLHFLWIGTAIALAGMLLHRSLGWLSRERPGLRYATALLTLAVFAVAPLGIAWHLSSLMKPTVPLVEVEPQPSDPQSPAAALPPASENNTPDEPLVIDLAQTPIDPSPFEESVSEQVESIASVESHVEAVGYRRGTRHTKNTAQGMPRPSAVPYDLVSRLSSLATYLPWIWLVGAPLTFALLTTGLVGSEKLRRTAKPLSALGKSGDAIEQTLQRLAKTLDVSRKIAIGVSDRIAQPLLIGIVRPMILLPSAALTGWSPEELEMVLLHELTHVRRWDNLVNFGQRIVESLLFFHPCVWWLSHQVRIDREQCVDAVVVGRTAKPQAYAELLVNFAAARNQLPPTLAASAMARHPLAGRVRKILNLEDEPMLVKRSTVTLAGLAVLVVLSLLVWQPALESVANEPKPKRVAQLSELSPESEANEQENGTQGEAASLATDETDGTDDNSSPAITDSSARLLASEVADLQRAIAKLELEMVELKIQKELELQEANTQKNAQIDQEIAEKLREDPTLTAYRNEIAAFTQELVKLKNSNDQESAMAIRRLEEMISISERNLNEHRAKSEKEIRKLINDRPQGESRIMIQHIMRMRAAQSQINQLTKKLESKQDLLEKKLASTNHSPFPTLEEQRAADLVYKLLNVEVEKLSDEELARVKAKQFVGGLKVTSTQNSDTFRGPFSEGDLLVGLHVWPTTSLADIRTIFERDDLDELSPLKFYVIRQGMRPPEKGNKRQQEQARKGRGGRGFGGEFGGGYGGEYGGEFGGGEYGAAFESEMEAVDVLITGRIEPNLEAWRAIQQRREAKQAQQESNPIAGLTQQQSTDLRRQVAALKQQRAALQIRHNAFAKLLAASDPKERSTRALEQSELLENEMDQLDAVIEKISSRRNTQSIAERRQESQLEHAKMAKESLVAQLKEARAEQEASLEAWRNVEETPDSEVLEETVKPELRKKYFESKAKVEQLEKQLGINKSPQQPQPKYLYAGKPFEHWRDLFKYELSTERRIEAIKALAAFGRVGKGKEAAETIMEVAGQYDSSESTESIKKMREAIVRALSRSIDSDYWLPALSDRFKEEPLQWDSLVYHLAIELRNSRQVDMAPLLKQLCLTDESNLVGIARSLFLEVYEVKHKEDVRQVTEHVLKTFKERLDEQLLMPLVAKKGGGRMLVELARSDKKEIAQSVRKLLNSNSGKYVASEVINLSLEILEDIQQQEHWLSAIRNITAIGRMGRKTSKVLQRIYESDDAKTELRVAALFALANRDVTVTHSLAREVFSSEEGLTLSDEEIDQLISTEQEAIFGKQD